MELGLSLGEAPKPFGFLEKPRDQVINNSNNNNNKGSGFCMALSIGPCSSTGKENDQNQADEQGKERQHQRDDAEVENGPSVSTGSPPVQLDLLPRTPVPRSHGFPWISSENGCSEAGVGLDVNRVPAAVVVPAAEDADEGATAVSSSPNSNSGGSSFQMDICLYNYRNNGGNNYKRDHSEGEAERASSRASDDDDANGSTRKKLRLSKEQSAFLEESFKEHNTLNPKQKLALAKQLNLRPRQVEVWFQNRRARTKLKQTEVDCEYLKRCCETLTEENRRLHKELQELRALKTSNPFYMQLPATTLTMCPSCERVATTTTNSTATPTPTISTTNSNANDSKPVGFPINKQPRFYPFSHTQNHPHKSSAAS
ncbi:homeobox-leucine zipper protein HOX11 [Ziziphus jujuba]|uniref:Homeobox-leucine zipper protein HOX11 n=2 Tax=Ziziphus jujuba TaxID=326968 RepID=A0A6P3Z7D8_ZIZJJ|nr:homeobox-leucine zipper protein HOX11 [Ziziphus jujuba]KAH7544811.1 hypothetical protein FEM48_Zijuj01G0025900 [Ziziphus jujuba var. spinosa]